MRLCAVVVVCGALLVGCKKTLRVVDPEYRGTRQQSPEWFTDATAELGLDFIHDPGPIGNFFMPEMVGSGAALFDYDNDGRLDVYLLQNAGAGSTSANRLFRQGADGKFHDVSAGSGLDFAARCMGVAAGDVNNDGFIDVLVTEYRGARLFLNQRDGHFNDVTRSSGVDDPHWGVSAAFLDYDRDGWLDLVIVNYVNYLESVRCHTPNGKLDYCGPTAFEGTVTQLFRNRGEQAGTDDAPVHFEDVTASSGLAGSSGPGLGVLCADFDGDRWIDILVANDAAPNTLWINRQDGTFKNEAILRGIGYNALGRPQANMGIAIGDVRGSGMFDIFITHLTEETHVLWAQGPRGYFQDRTAEFGLAEAQWRGTGFGTALVDADQDGFPDLVVVNGRVRKSLIPSPANDMRPGSTPFWNQYAERNQIFANQSGVEFRDVSLDNPALCGASAVGRGLACGDIDGDGGIDLLVTNVGQAARVYRNVAPHRGHWLLVRAVETAAGGRDALGAEITLHVAGRRRNGWVAPASSYACSSDPRAHFGLGNSERVDGVEVLWPDGTREFFPGSPADAQVVVRHGEGRQVPGSPAR